MSTQLAGDSGGARRLSLHVLGYFLREVPGEDFRSWLLPITATRHHRNLQLMEKLRKEKIDISWDDFPGLGPERAARSHFARVLVKKGSVPDLQSAFDIYLSDTVLEGIERTLPSAQEAVGRICRQGGIASLAHPGRLRWQLPAVRSLIKQLMPCGLGALEAYHSDHTPQETAAFLQIAAEEGLLVTGGSDFHGENKPDIRLGSGRNGNVQVPDEVLAVMKNHCEANRAEPWNGLSDS